MKKKIFICLCILANIGSYAQNANFVWAKQFGGSFSEQGNSIIHDASGNVYTIGSFVGVVDFDPGAGTYTLSSLITSYDIFISKLDAAGNFIWAKQLGGTGNDYGYSICLDASGNIYTTGYFFGTSDFDPGAATYNLTSAGSNDIFVSKLDASGNFIWAKKLGGTGNDQGEGIIVDASSNVYTTGYFENTPDFDPGISTYTLSSFGNGDIFVSKLDASGNFVWAKKMGGSGNELGNSIKLDASGNVYTTGVFTLFSDFDPGTGVYNLISNGNYDAFISKLDALGNFVWAKQLGGNNADYGYDIDLDASGNVYTTGVFAATPDFDPGAATYTLSSFGSNDIFVSKLDASGNFIWAKQLGGIGNDVSYGITLDASGNVYTTGVFSVIADFDPATTTYTLNSFGGTDIFISKLDALGNFVWAKQLGGSNSDLSNGVSVDASDNVCATGYFQNTSDFDPGTSSYNLTSFGSTDIFVHKMCQSSPTLGVISGPTNLCFNSAGNYTAAPGTGGSYTWSLPTGWSGTSTTNIISAFAGSSGIFTVVLSNGCGTSPQQTLNVTVNTLPTVSASSSSSLICTGQTATLTASGATSYTWNTTATTTVIFVSPTVTTSYTVNGTGANGCTNSTTITQNVSICSGSVDQTSNEPSLIYPNPISDQVTIKSENRSDLKIINVLGQIEHKTKLEKGINFLSLSNLNPGIYYFVIEQNNGIVTQRIIKQ
ncbi:MAG: SBBP repeat-containing protein [Bacteroidota bacterium]|nr:SBBP repeat-containing protein [Bacteroidota bacterium]